MLLASGCVKYTLGNESWLQKSKIAIPVFVFVFFYLKHLDFLLLPLQLIPVTLKMSRFDQGTKMDLVIRKHCETERKLQAYIDLFFSSDAYLFLQWNSSNLITPVRETAIKHFSKTIRPWYNIHYRLWEDVLQTQPLVLQNTVKAQICLAILTKQLLQMSNESGFGFHQDFFFFFNNVEWLPDMYQNNIPDSFVQL